MIHYGRAPFLDRFPRSRVPVYPRHSGPLSSEVVVVGGGLTGCAAAYAFAAAGIQVTLLEADRLGSGATHAVPGWISEDPGVSFIDLEKLIGVAELAEGLLGRTLPSGVLRAGPRTRLV
jgi:hypothetical protein